MTSGNVPASSPAASKRSPTTKGRCTRQRNSRAQSEDRRGSTWKATTLCAPRAWKGACRAPSTNTTRSVRKRISVKTFRSSSRADGSASSASSSSMTSNKRWPPASRRRRPCTTLARRRRASAMGDRISSAMSLVSQSTGAPAATQAQALAKARRNPSSGRGAQLDSAHEKPSSRTASSSLSSSSAGTVRCTVRPSKRRPGAPAKRASSANSADLPTCAEPHTATHRREEPKCCINSQRSRARPQKSSTRFGSRAEQAVKGEGHGALSSVEARRSKRVAPCKDSPGGNSMYFSASPRKPTCGTVRISYLAMSKACPRVFEPAQKA
mmetsp:Transcript_52350/g.167903  ORF Transcript_52350/g.167903 Transcript_52350/m.167903 type:complete len:325 (+) Transcript_52350:200-1174(+)